MPIDFTELVSEFKYRRKGTMRLWVLYVWLLVYRGMMRLSLMLTDVSAFPVYQSIIQ
jgi:hypothetical protein